MGTDFKTAVRRLRMSWPRALLTWGVSSLAVALFLALAALVDALLLKQPFPGADTVAVIGRQSKTPTGQLRFRLPLSDAKEISDRSGLRVASMGWPLPLGRSPSAPMATWVSTNFFDVLGVRSRLGRTFADDDEGVSGRAVISDRLWRARFGGDTSIVGQYVELGDDRFTVIGVLAPGFEVPSGTDLWRIGSTGYTYVVVTRLGEDTSSEALGLQLPGWTAQSLKAYLAPGDSTQALVLLGAATLLVCGAWAHLGLSIATGATGRVHDIGIRLAVGAGAVRSVAPILLEGGFGIAIVSGLGLAAGPVVLSWLTTTLPPELLAGRRVSFDWPHLGLAMAVAVAGLTIVSAVALPSILMSVRAARSPDRVAGRGVVGQIRHSRWMVGTQFAVAVPVLYLVGLAAYSFHALANANLGLTPDGVLVARVPTYSRGFTLGDDPFEGSGQRMSDLQSLIDRVARVPGVEAVAVSTDRIGHRPTMTSTPIRLADRGPGDAVVAQVADVSAGYFDALRIPLRSGTVFEGPLPTTLNWRAPLPGVVVDEGLAAILGKGADVVGWPVIVDFTPSRITGVVGSVRARRPDESVEPRLYRSVSPHRPLADNLLVRFTGPVEPVGDAVVLAIQETFRITSAVDTVLLADEVTRLQGPYRARYQLLSVMSWVAAGLAATVLFGVCVASVAYRRTDLAVRLALGATRSSVVWVALRGVLVAAAVGSVVGLAIGVGIGRQIAHLLYDIKPLAPTAIAASALLLLTVCAIGIALPIRQAWRIDVATVLRSG